jgi:hypothetical protein
MSKLAHNRKLLYFQTAVLAEPSDYNSCRPGQNSFFFRIFSLQNPTPLDGFGEKVDLLSKSLGLKTAVLAVPSDLSAGRAGQNS